MHLAHGRHLAYCTNIHRGEDWPETFAALRTHTLAVRARVCPPDEPFGIGLRLSDLASRQLAAEPKTRDDFRRWLEENNAYVFTINGFPFGRFHGTRVKEQVYAPDWTADARVEYTCRLFDLLAEWLPPGVGGSVSTLPGSFKGFDADEDAMRRNLRRCAAHITRASERTGRALSLALEPEPLCWFENTAETLDFFARLGGGDLPIGVCFDACHFAVEYEPARTALEALTAAGVPVAKLHLSSALKVRPLPAVRQALRAFADDVYLHQTIIRRNGSGALTRCLDLAPALDSSAAESGDEWRIHFHVPLHSPPGDGFDTTTADLLGALDWLQKNPSLCQHLEMETYTWEVLPPELRSASVEEQLTREYEWTLARLRERSLA